MPTSAADGVAPESSTRSACARHLQDTVSDETIADTGADRNFAEQPGEREAGRQNLRAVASVGTIYSCFTICAGRKKCRPRKRSGSLTP